MDLQKCEVVVTDLLQLLGKEPLVFSQCLLDIDSEILNLDFLFAPNLHCFTKV